jgi:hypothetical protein
VLLVLQPLRQLLALLVVVGCCCWSLLLLLLLVVVVVVLIFCGCHVDRNHTWASCASATTPRHTRRPRVTVQTENKPLTCSRVRRAMPKPMGMRCKASSSSVTRPGIPSSPDSSRTCAVWLQYVGVAVVAVVVVGFR